MWVIAYIILYHHYIKLLIRARSDSVVSTVALRAPCTLSYRFLQLSSIWNENCAAEAENALTDIKSSHFMNRKINLIKLRFWSLACPLSCLRLYFERTLNSTVSQFKTTQIYFKATIYRGERTGNVKEIKTSAMDTMLKKTQVILFFSCVGQDGRPHLM